MKPSKELGSVNIYMDFINYQGNVTESVLIATCKNRNYANVLVSGLDELRDEELIRYRMEVI